LASIATSYKVIGPFSPKEFSDVSTLSATIAEAAGNLGSISDTNTLVDSKPMMIRGNVFIKLTWTVS
jgi:hypothetical protein